MAESRIGADAREKIERAWPDLISTVATGGNIGDACERAGVTRGAVYAYQRENPGAREQWALAREESADAYADRIASLIEGGMPDAQVARVKIDALRWLAAKRNPRLYSDKTTLDVNVKTVDLTRIIQDANARLAAARTIEGAIVPALITSALPAGDSERTLADLL